MLPSPSLKLEFREGWSNLPKGHTMAKPSSDPKVVFLSLSVPLYMLSVIMTALFNKNWDIRPEHLNAPMVAMGWNMGNYDSLQAFWMHLWFIIIIPLNTNCLAMFISYSSMCMMLLFGIAKVILVILYKK